MKRLLIAGILAIAMLPTYAAQYCNPNIPGRFANRYTIGSAGDTVTDRVTGLQWQRCPLGKGMTGPNQCGEAQFYTWGEALKWHQVASTDPNAQKYASLKKEGWRMPNIKELLSLAEMHCFDPSIDIAAFPSGSTYINYWSNTPDVGMVEYVVTSPSKSLVRGNTVVTYTETIQRYHRAFYVTYGPLPEGALLARIVERPANGILNCYESPETATRCEFPVLLVKNPR